VAPQVQGLEAALANLAEKQRQALGALLTGAPGSGADQGEQEARRRHEVTGGGAWPLFSPRLEVTAYPLGVGGPAA
jgi:hypothetical protein